MPFQISSFKKETLKLPFSSSKMKQKKTKHLFCLLLKFKSPCFKELPKHEKSPTTLSSALAWEMPAKHSAKLSNQSVTLHIPSFIFKSSPCTAAALQQFFVSTMVSDKRSRSQPATLHWTGFPKAVFPKPSLHTSTGGNLWAVTWLLDTHCSLVHLCILGKVTGTGLRKLCPWDRSDLRVLLKHLH